MNVHPYAMIRRVRDLPGHLHELAEHLQLLSARVRASVTEALGDTVARTVKSVLTRCWAGQCIFDPAPVREGKYAPYSWRSQEDDNPWSRESSHWNEPDVDFVHSPIPHSPDATTKVGLLAVALQAAGWWLHRRGTWFGALGIGLLFGGVVLIGGRVAVVGLGLAGAVHEIVVLQHILSSRALQLSEV